MIELAICRPWLGWGWSAIYYWSRPSWQILWSRKLRRMYLKVLQVQFCTEFSGVVLFVKFNPVFESCKKLDFNIKKIQKLETLLHCFSYSVQIIIFFSAQNVNIETENKADLFFWRPSFFCIDRLFFLDRDSVINICKFPYHSKASWEASALGVT